MSELPVKSVIVGESGVCSEVIHTLGQMDEGLKETGGVVQIYIVQWPFIRSNGVIDSGPELSGFCSFVRNMRLTSYLCICASCDQITVLV